MNKSNLDGTLIMTYTAITWIANFCKLLNLADDPTAGDLYIVAHVFGLIPQVSWIMAWL